MTTNGHTDLAALVDSQSYDIETLVERLAALELALEDEGWQRLGDDGREFSSDARRKIVELARSFALKNPLVKRGIQVQTSYVWGGGCEMKAADEQIDTVIQSFLDDEQNQAELTAHQAREEKERELQTDGDLFLVLFPDALTGRVRVRSVYTGEIADIVTNPDDRKDPWYYRREWNEIDATSGTPRTVQRIAYYPDWRYTPRNRPKTIGGHEVRWASPVFHTKVGGYSDWRFGCSEVYAAIDWARAYKEFLEDWATFTRALSRYAHKIGTKGGKAGIAAARARLNTTLGTTGGVTPETNPPSTTGATWIGAEGTTIEPFRIGGANVSMDDGRRMLLMVAAAQGLPETFYGDVSVGTLATANSLDRPTELLMLARQALWASVYRRLFEYIILWAVKAQQGPLRGLGTVIRTRDGDELVESVKWSGETDATVQIAFPPIVAPDRKADVNAIVEIGTSGGKALTTLDMQTFLKLALTAIGVQDVDSVIEQVEEAMAEEDAQAAADAAQAHQQAIELAQAKAAATPPPVQPAPAAGAAVQEASIDRPRMGRPILVRGLDSIAGYRAQMRLYSESGALLTELDSQDGQIIIDAAAKRIIPRLDTVGEAARYTIELYAPDGRIIPLLDGPISEVLA